jgi:transposase
MKRTNEEWNRIEPIIVSSTPSKNPRGRPERDPCEAFSGILWILRTDAPWKDLPERYDSGEADYKVLKLGLKQGKSNRAPVEIFHVAGFQPQKLADMAKKEKIEKGLEKGAAMFENESIAITTPSNRD